MKSNPRPAEIPAWNADVPADVALDLRLARTLECAPQVVIPADFAQRVARRLPHQGRRAQSRQNAPLLKRTPVAFRIQVAALMVLASLMLTLAAFAGPVGQVLWKSLESVLCAQFVLLTLWMTVEPQRQR